MLNKDPQSETLCISDPLAKTVLDSISAHLAILDQDGVILETNQAWQSFAISGKAKEKVDFIGINYLSVCDASTGKGADDAHAVAAGIRSVISGEIKEFTYDYPCHSPTGRHWYYMRAIRMAAEGPVRVVVSHSEITALKLAEEALVEREHERDRLRHSLELAMEVQQNLLPKSTPKIKELDIAAKSIYCDETGGDYPDFPDVSEAKNLKIAVGTGLALGLNLTSSYEKNEKAGIVKGDVVVLSTDGIFEARNTAGQMIGKDRIEDIIQKNSELSAKELRNTIFTAAQQF